MDLEALAALVGPESVIVDPDRLATHVRDWTGRWTGHTPAVIRPADTAQVAEVIRWCHHHQVAVVAQGGNTGLVGGSVPLRGELVLSLAALDDVRVDADAGQVIAGAGATLAAVQQAAEAAGWLYPVDLGARDSATIGGTVATNAGGLRVIRHGDTRRQLLGVEAVTGSGEVVGDLRGLEKDNTGYHLPSLLAGSEGTLAVITRTCLRLVAPPAEWSVALLGFESEAGALATVGPLRRSLTDLQALELFWADGLALVCDTFGLERPLPGHHAAYLLVEVAGSPGVVDRLAAGLADIGVDLAAAAVAETDAQRRALWRYREAHTEAINLVGVPHKQDVTVPLRHMARFVDDARSLVADHAPGARLWLFGHAGDGNLHVNVTGVDPADEALDAALLELAARAGGSISAEHGIGRAKAAQLHLNRTAAELDLYRGIKAAFDPAGILNPGVILTG